MRTIQVIELKDGSLHRSIGSAERHLLNVLSRGENLDVFEMLANKSALDIKGLFVDNEVLVQNVLDVVFELNQVLKADI